MFPVFSVICHCFFCFLINFYLLLAMPDLCISSFFSGCSERGFFSACSVWASHCLASLVAKRGLQPLGL